MSRSVRSLVQSTSGSIASVPWWIWAVAGAALAVRLAVIGYGLPYEFDPDERAFVDPAWRMVESESHDPGFYGHPAATLMDVLAGMFAAYGLIGALLGSLESMAAAGEAYLADVTHFFLMGRLVVAISGVAVVLLTYALLRALRASPFWAVVAALSLSLSLAMIQFSTVVRADMIMSAFLLATVLVMVRTLDRPSGAAFAFAGVLLGLAVTSKYPGVLAAVPILSANVTLVLEARITPRRGLLWLATSAIACLVTAMLVAPYLFWNLGEALTAMRMEAGAGNPTAVGSGPVGNVWAYLTNALPWALGLIATALAVIGLVVMLASREPRIASLTFWAFLVTISALSQWWQRWALPMIPFVAIGAGYLLSLLDDRIRGWRPADWRVLWRVAGACLIVLPLVYPTFNTIHARALNLDTRAKAIAWLNANVPKGSTILIDSYTTQVSSNRYEVLIARDGALVRWADVSAKVRPEGYFSTIGGEWYGTPDGLLQAIDSKGIDYIVLTDLWIDFFRGRAGRYPVELATYEALLQEYPMVETFDGRDAPLGWPILILDSRGAAGSD